MKNNQLEIVRSTPKPSVQWPVWVKALVIASPVAILLGVSMIAVYQSEKALKDNVANKLETILHIETEAVRYWVKSEHHLTTLLASDIELAEVLSEGRRSADATNGTGPELGDRKLAVVSRKLRKRKFLLMRADGKAVASSGESWLLKKMNVLANRIRTTGATAKSEKTGISLVLNVTDTAAEPSSYALVVAAPIQHPDNGVVGFLAIGYDVRDELTNVLASSRSGKTVETFAVTQSGKLISESRFENIDGQLDFIQEAFREQIHIGNYSIQSDLSGLSDQRGVESVFAYRWLPSLGMGLVTRMDRAEAFAPVSKIRTFVWTLFGLVILTTISTLFYRWYVYRLRALARQADLNRKRLGSYELEEKIGEGGMGVVYRAKHALMRRSTAIKVLPPEKSSQAAIERFEREVQYTSQLQHPNTIAIYDYGRTDNGLFYYAMELLDGWNLEQLVNREDRLPDGRVIKILEHVCESLREAHSLGLIHRDIKPANIMVCDRGGAVDTVKVLDFGVVRDRSDGSSASAETLSGTPTYMAPECFTNPADIDSRVDIFALGAVGHFLLTGQPLLNADSLSDLFRFHHKDVSANAKMAIYELSSKIGLRVSRELVDLISRCVSSNRGERPASVEAVLTELSSCRPEHSWNSEQAESWWRCVKECTSEKAREAQAEVLSSDSSLGMTKAFLRPQCIAESGKTARD